ncbi:F-box/LRR-repeat protein 4-like [Rhododendron vialii]|uniref:F-box/LRR-repeat protein 4-like n=1 Tax=Rhododendron vialii TaxID=182163 RepID=UPI00265F79A8|nr:F-box/LRR-repeat protein 4-like [Rhododendron vialii]
MATSCKDLPDECWELIFKRLHHSHLESPSLSCKRFLSITNTLRTHLKILDPTLIIPLSKRFPRLDSIDLSSLRNGQLLHVVIDIATSGLNLKTLDLSESDRLPLESLKVLGSRMKNLRVLMCSCLLTLRDMDLVVIADSMPCLEDLDISEPINRFEAAVTDSGIEVLSSKLKGLRKIDVSGNHYITDKSLLALSTNCVYLAEIFVLDSLGIFDSSVPDEFLQFIVKAGIPLKRLSLARSLHQSFTFSGISLFLNKYRSLERLCLAGTDFLADENISDLSQCLPALVLIDLDLCNNLTESTLFTLAKNCTFLEDISMDGADVGGGGGDRASDNAKNPRIKSLNLVKNLNLTNECLAKLASVCPSLEVLDVSSCKGITDNGIADFLKRGSKIRKLWINKCRAIKNIGNGFELSELVVLGAARSGINDDGLVVIGNTCRGLLNLNLDGCLGVTTVGLKEILTNCERLREINLTGCLNVSTETADWLVSSRPSLRKIILPHSSLSSGSQRELLLRHGCLVLSE